MALSIKETAEKFGISPYTLRYYENEGLIPNITRNTNGHRVYTEDDIDRISFIACLKSTGMPIAEIKRYLKLCQIGDSTIEERRKLLVTHKKRMLSKINKFNEYLVKIEWKIEHYETLGKELKFDTDTAD